MANYKINEFTGSINNWCDSVVAGLDDVVEVFGGKVHEELVERSPVDTGRFRANWQVTANEVPLYALNKYDKDGGKTIAAGKRRIERLVKGGGVRKLYFSNMLIYANSLEYGHSNQAPNGMVRIVSSKIGFILQEAIKESKRKNAL